MSPRPHSRPPPDAVSSALRRIWVSLGIQIRDARISRRWSVQSLADRASVSARSVYLVESGRAASIETVVRLGAALGLRLEAEFVDPRRRAEPGSRTVDLVHSALGEFEARHLRGLGYRIGIDEP